MTSRRPVVAVIGSGPAGLMGAEVLAEGGADVTVYEQMPNPGRKLLMAGRGGLNLTHSEPLERLLDRYGPARTSLEPAIRAFDPERLRAWVEGLGEPTFVGTSGRIFPRTMKATPLLRAWLRRLEALGVRLALRHRWTGWAADGGLGFEIRERGAPTLPIIVRPDATVLALGGASWPRLGSDGTWVETLAPAGIGVAPLAPANCGIRIDWSAPFRERFAGAPLKRVAMTADGETVRSEAIVTAGGLEGGAVYALSGRLRERLQAGGAPELEIDLRPDLDRAGLARRLREGGPKASMSNLLRKAAGLSPVAIGMLREVATGHAPSRDPETLAAAIKSVRLAVTGLAGLARAISTAGGIRMGELDGRFMLRARPGVFVAGEMLDWEAPTGGYLLQACLSTGAAAGRGVLASLADRQRR